MAIGSTKPPGATSFKQTAFGIIPRDELLRLELEGTKKGLDFIYSLFRKRQNTEITSDLILELHKTAFQWIFPDWAGKFRTIQVTYSDKEAPQYFKVPELIQNLCADLKIRLEHLPDRSEASFIDQAVTLLAWFQYQFVFIHPFQDYNGRVARMLTTLLSLKLGLPALNIEVESITDRQSYLAAMHTGDQGDLAPLEKLISKSLTQELESQTKVSSTYS